MRKWRKCSQSILCPNFQILSGYMKRYRGQLLPLFTKSKLCFQNSFEFTIKADVILYPFRQIIFFWTHNIFHSNGAYLLILSRICFLCGYLRYIFFRKKLLIVDPWILLYNFSRPTFDRSHLAAAINSTTE